MARISKSQLLKLQKKYHTDQAIGELFSITRQAVHQLRLKYSLEPVPEKNGERDTEIVRLYKEGVAGTRIAKRYDLSVSQVYRVINKVYPIQGRNKRR
jgi:DNA invertase Pin-like site-specific DNA recombinase